MLTETKIWLPYSWSQYVYSDHFISIFEALVSFGLYFPHHVLQLAFYVLSQFPFSTTLFSLAYIYYIILNHCFVSFFACVVVLGTVWKVSKDGLDAGSKFVPVSF